MITSHKWILVSFLTKDVVQSLLNDKVLVTARKCGYWHGFVVTSPHSTLSTQLSDVCPRIMTRERPTVHDTG